jgi:hypothetical protein
MTSDAASLKFRTHDLITRGRATSGWLTNYVLVMAVLVPAFALAGVIDPRTLAGESVWAKPFKFAVSTVLYGTSLLWMMGLVTSRRRWAGRVASATAGIFTLEMVLIVLQAARGVHSHFNASTVFDFTVFMTMGAAIGLQTLMATAGLVLLLRSRISDRAMGIAARAGLAVAILGASMGGLMSKPTSDQLARAKETGVMKISGAHSVGTPDGGPGLPVVGWNREAGDLRPAHALGLHAAQALPLSAFFLFRRRRSRGSMLSDAKQARLVLIGSGGYAGLTVLLAWQALRGEALLAPSLTVVGVAVALCVTAVVAAWAVARAGRDEGTKDSMRPARAAAGIG